MQITYHFDTTITQNAQAGAIEGAILAAIEYYVHEFTNNITLNFNFTLQNLPSDVLANNIGPGQNYSYAAVAAALNAHITSGDDRTAYGTLPFSDPTGGSGNDFFLPRGEAEALGLTVNPLGSGQYDDTVNLSSSLVQNNEFNYDPNHRAAPGQFDAVDVIAHEMSEFGMGRIGILGTYLGHPGNWTPLDLFSYASASVRQLSGGTHYFSIDGQHLLQQYNNPQNGGDAVDWLPSIQGDSYGDGYPDVVGQITPVDVREMNILGWTRAPATVDDFTGDGVSAVLFRNPMTGDTGYLAMNGGQGTWHGLGASSTAYNVVGTGDFNGDYTADILYRNPVTGDTGYSAMPLGGGPGTWVDLGSPSTTYHVVGIGDFNGNGTSDILFQNPTTGDVGYSLMNGGRFSTWHDLGSTSYNVVGVGDFTRSGISDVLYQSPTTGDVGYFALAAGGQGTWHDIGPTTYNVIEVGDFNGDGTSDILYFNNASRDLGYYTLPPGGGPGSWHDLFTLNTAFDVVAVGDYNGDGTTDILFQDPATGDTQYLAMPFNAIANPNQLTFVDIGNPSTSYAIINDGSDNGVGNADVVASDVAQGPACSATGKPVVVAGGAGITFSPAPGPLGMVNASPGSIMPGNSNGNAGDIMYANNVEGLIGTPFAGTGYGNSSGGSKIGILMHG